jgi:hypothetical protein
VVEPIESDKDEDPYDTIIPGAPREPGVEHVKPRVKCISELRGQISDSDEESPYDTLPRLSVDGDKCDDKDCKGCVLSAEQKDEGRVSPYEMADECHWPALDLTHCHEHLGSGGDLNKLDAEAEEESPYDTVPQGRPMSVEYVDEPLLPEGDLEIGVKKRHPTYTTVPDDVLGPYFKERMETFFVDNVSSSSEESLADEGEFGMDAKRMSLEISGFEDETEGQGQGQSEGQGQVNENDDSFVFVDGTKYPESLQSIDSEDIGKRESVA